MIKQHWNQLGDAGVRFKVMNDILEVDFVHCIHPTGAKGSVAKIP